ncbi:MAG TPA: DUF1707 and DUF4190 domain-containing protein [Streptosporangiaceae bacterium]|nr:DUF1707 and DUF4190 domain-containing protein [Streptosporangiaceae bacterium]
MALDPYQGMPPGRYGHMRASTADRERAIDVLKAGFAEGRLDKDEYDERAGRVYGSRTYAELAALTSDLPVGPLGPLNPQQAYAPVPMRRRTNGMAVTAFILAFFPGIPGIIAVFLGFAARRRARERGQGGEGLATAAIILGAAFTLLFFYRYGLVF